MRTVETHRLPAELPTIPGVEWGEREILERSAENYISHRTHEWLEEIAEYSTSPDPVRQGEGGKLKKLIFVRLEEEEKAKIESAAATDNRSINNWCVLALLKAAHQEKKEVTE